MHLAIGVVAGLFILNMAASGILIAYQKPITAFAERSQRTVAAPAGAARLDVEALVAKVQAARPDAHLSGLVLYSDSTAAAMFYVGRDNNVLYADPYTGAVLGDGQKAVRGFFQFVTSWHRWLALEGTARPIGQAVTGTLSIAYFLLLFTGLILWLPKQWSRSRVRQGALLNLKLRGRARNWNWHNVAGLWFAPLLLLVTLTGIVMSHDWAGDLLFRLTGNPVPEHRREGGRGGGRDGGGPVDIEGINPLWTQAEKQVAGWHSISLRFPRSSDAPVTFLIDSGSGSRPDTVAQLVLDRDSGEVVRWQPYATENAGQKLRSWVRPIHTGEAGGIPGESIAVVAALGGITLAWTGLSMACRRFFGSRDPVPSPVSPTQPESISSTL
ncbi:MAG: PepSY-associated TM helix domain-containing protein [Verrucomicrobiota bacterium]